MSPRRASLSAVLIVLLFGSCSDDDPLEDRRPFTISGRLQSDFGCYLLRDGKSYELYDWDDAIPPLGSDVSLRVKRYGYGSSICMAGIMVDVVEVLDVRTDFRTAPVTQDETWSREDDIVLGEVEVLPGATLTVLPGTLIKIIPEGGLHVRGRIIMEGTAGDSVRIDGILSPDQRPWRPGPVSFDSVAANSRVRFVATQSTLRMSGEAPVLESIRGAVSVFRGTAILRDCALSGVSADEANIAVENSAIAAVDGVFATIDLEDNELSDVLLSYSRATVIRNTFRGPRSTIVFHGPSGGTFERNTFEGDSTHVEVRHDSDPLFEQNNFVGRALTIECNTYSGPCIEFQNNWWGTTDEGVIAGRFNGRCDFCYRPWLTEPVVW